jgi:hypothetical protein
MLKSLLAIKYPPKRRIEDYVHNKVKAEIIDDSSNGRQIGEGGACVISAYRMNLSFIGSTDSDKPVSDNKI